MGALATRARCPRPARSLAHPWAPAGSAAARRPGGPCSAVSCTPVYPAYPTLAGSPTCTQYLARPGTTDPAPHGFLPRPRGSQVWPSTSLHTLCFVPVFGVSARSRPACLSAVLLSATSSPAGAVRTARRPRPPPGLHDPIGAMTSLLGTTGRREMYLDNGCCSWPRRGHTMLIKPCCAPRPPTVVRSSKGLQIILRRPALCRVLHSSWLRRPSHRRLLCTR